MIHAVLLKMMEHFGKEVHYTNHALKVHGFASAICKAEQLDQRDIDLTEIAAIVHDVGIPESIRKYNSSMGKYQEIEGPPIARKLLTECGLENEIIERVCFLVGNHHTYTKIDAIDFQILVEADFLVNIFEEKINASAIESFRNKYFKTKTGLRILDSIY